MNKTITLLFFCAMFCVGAIAASAQAPTATPTAAASKFDADLAKKVGADPYGMRPYVLAILKTGPKDAEVKGEALAALQKGHFENMGRLAKEGKLAVAGPFKDPERKYRGLFILAVPTVAEAKQLTDTDPMVKAGVLMVEFVQWYGSASLMLGPELHEKVAEKSF